VKKGFESVSVSKEIVAFNREFFFCVQGGRYLLKILLEHFFFDAIILIMKTHYQLHIKKSNAISISPYKIARGK
jgi:hypothetical protein